MTSGIQGNTQNKQQAATTQRATDKLSTAKFGVNIAIILILITGVVALSIAGVGFFGSLLAVVALFIAANVIKNYPIFGKTWPKALKSLSWVALTVLLLASGIGQWTGSVFNGIESTASCAADPTQEKCQEVTDETTAEKARQEQEAAEKARLAALRTAQGQQFQKYPLIANCTGYFAQKRDCKRVTLRGNATFSYQAGVGHKPAWNPQEVVTVKDYGMGSIDVKSKQGNLVTVNVFQLPVQ